MLDKEKAVATEKHIRKHCGPRYLYIFRCSYGNCGEFIRVRQDALAKSSGMCQSHSHRKRPYESIYNVLRRDHRGPKIELTYEEFLTLMVDTKCHYCETTILRTPFPTIKGKFISIGHQLDRKDPNGPYSLDNCVSCCIRCNRLKSSWFNYKEFLLIGRALKTINTMRES